jgi:hypothetical protein
MPGGLDAGKVEMSSEVGMRRSEKENKATSWKQKGFDARKAE